LEIEYGAFSYCYGLESIIVDSGNAIYHSNGNCIIATKSRELIVGCKASIIPNDESVRSIAESAFEGCIGLERIVIPEGIHTIGKTAFCACANLEEITLPNKIKTLSVGIFEGCTNLKIINMPSSLTQVSMVAFDGCSGIENIVLPDGVEYIGAWAFDCENLKSIIIPASVTEIDYRAFNVCPPSMIIYGYAGSYAETFANEEDITFVALDSN